MAMEAGGAEGCVEAGGGAYTLTPIEPVGAEVRGLELRGSVDGATVERIKRDVHRHRVLVFKEQGEVSAQRHVEISEWFGPLRSTFYQHPQTRHPDVFRVSNDEAEGCRGVGRTGWHIDGSFLPNPYSHALYHMVHVPTTGDTVFCPLEEFIAAMPEDTRAKYDRLWMRSDRRTGPVHPILYRHPVTGRPTMMIHLGMIDGFVVDRGLPSERDIDRSRDAAEFAALRGELERMFDDFWQAGRALSHRWQRGDFIISDNLAVAHIAAPESQLPRAEVGLRVLHRTTVEGQHVPAK